MYTYHRCNYFCRDATHTDVVYATGDWTAAQLLATLQAQAHQLDFVALAVAPAPELPPEVPATHSMHLSENGTVGARASLPVSGAWRLTFQWPGARTDTAPAPKEP